MKRLVLLALAAALLMSCADSKEQQRDAEMESRYLGADFSKVMIESIDGGPQALNDQDFLNGKPVILNVWATWCTPCLKEMPTLDALGKEGKYTVVAIATDKDTATVKEFLKQQNWGSGMTMMFDRLGAVTRKEMGATSIPVTYVLDPSLTVKKVAVGERDWSHPSMARQIEKALAKH